VGSASARSAPALDLPLTFRATRSYRVPMPASPFQLVAPFEPTGDQPAAIQALVKGLTEKQRFQVLEGVTGSGKTFSMANVIQRWGRPTIVI
jgi:excinuclease ABC subunit B